MADHVLSPAVPQPTAATATSDAFRLSFGMRLQKIGLNPTLLAGLIILTIMVLTALAAPLLTPYDPNAQKLDEAFKPPFSPNHVLGTDNFGRDIWSRILYATRLDLQIGVISVVFPFVFGTFVGISAGYLGGHVDTVLMRVLDVMMAFPFLVLVVAI